MNRLPDVFNFFGDSVVIFLKQLIYCSIIKIFHYREKNSSPWHALTSVASLACIRNLALSVCSKHSFLDPRCDRL